MTRGRRRTLFLFLALAGLALWIWRGRRAGSEGAQPLLLYCAAGLKPPAEELADDFGKRHGVQVQIQYGGSGTLLSNVQLARTGDLYLAADSTYLDIAARKGLVAETLPLARMTPVIAVRKGNPRNIRALEDLARPDVRVSFANPDAASVGKQARAILLKAGLWERVEKQVRDAGVFKPTVGDVAADILIGAVDCGVVWDATIAQHPEMESVRTPELDGGRIEVVIGVLRFSRQPTPALRFARYLNSRPGNAVFRKHGYEPVDGDAWAWEPEITFFCGAINRRAVEGILKAFAEREGVTINTVYNGCGILTGQMKAIGRESGGRGFPDLYMACDRYYLENVKDWFQEDVDISEASIVIAVPKGNPRSILRLEDLATEGMRVAVGQPQQCTIGALTRVLLEKTGLHDAIMKNVVMQAASSAMLVPTVTTRSVDAALVYNTDAHAESGRVDLVAIHSPYAKAVQPFSIAKSSEHKYLGRRLFQALARSRDQFESAGFHFRLGPEGQSASPP